MLAQLGQGGPPLPQGLQEDQQEQGDPLKVLQECIQGLPGVLTALHDPQDVQDATQALLTLTKIQTRLMGRSNGATQTNG
jgi:hypothetical protein